MNTYTCSFNGRKINAMGIFYPITVQVSAESEQDARLKLYDSYEHLSFVNIKQEVK